MKVVGIDQSLSKCAMVFREDGSIIDLGVSRTGSAKVKDIKKGVSYYDTLQEQIHHIVQDVIDFVVSIQPDMIVFEALSFGSVGNASRDLACLYGAIREELIQKGFGNITYEVSPTSNKAFARSFLPVERQYVGVKRDGKPKLVVMDKKMMVEAVRCVYGEDYLKGFNYSNGLDDLADATWLAFYGEEHIGSKNS